MFRRGFSLVEMLAVVAIIIVLLAIAVPSIHWTSQASQKTQCMMNQHNLNLGLISYGTNNAGVYPPYYNGSHWADAYGLRRDHPYSGPTDRKPCGFGYLVSSGTLEAGETKGGKIWHCPSFDNSTHPTSAGHCMDYETRWGYGASGWDDHPNHRILVSTNYRGTSFMRQYNTFLRASNAVDNFVMVIDTPDLRFRGEKSQYNAHGGYNVTFGDGSGIHFPDPEYRIDQILLQHGNGLASGRQPARADEAMYRYIQEPDSEEFQ